MILPSASHQSFRPLKSTSTGAADNGLAKTTFHQIPNQLRWDPFDLDSSVDWVHSLNLIAGAGDPSLKSGIGIYVYAAGKSMEPKTAFYSADGDFLIVPQRGVLDIQTELGHLLVRPNEIAVIPRGIRYRVTLHEEQPVRGYILELYQGHFELPPLGAAGSQRPRQPERLPSCLWLPSKKTMAPTRVLDDHWQVRRQSVLGHPEPYAV